MAEYIKLAEAPHWVLQYPLCSACNVDLDTDCDSWICPVCGTTWDMNAGDGDTGELYESWSGESLDGEPLTEEQASAEGRYRDRYRSHEMFPDLVPAPPLPAYRREATR